MVTNPYHLLWFGLFTAAAIIEVINLVMKERTVFLLEKGRDNNRQ